MRKISAHYIFPVSSKPIRNGVIVTNDDGIITDIIDTYGEIKEIPQLEFYNGVIVPGFVNAHCHLELSHLKNKIEKYIGLHNFIINIKKSKEIFYENAEILAEKNDFNMTKNGIVAIGDICNTDLTINIKKKSNIYYHSFCEAIGYEEYIKEKAFKKIEKVYYQFIENKLPASITPHSPYTVGNSLMKMISEHAMLNNQPVCIHNQESSFENEMFFSGTGKLIETLEMIGLDFNEWNIPGKSSLQYCLPYFKYLKKLLLVHNSFTNEEDIDFANCYNSDIHWILCPNSNIYIENSLPDIELFIRKKLNIAIGTDSYASNETQSILEEIKTIKNNFKNISFENLLFWSTLGGANALNINEKYGSFKIGKKPGMNLIENFDFRLMNISDESKICKLI